MGAKCTKTDYEWSYTDEPHATRRRIILEKHPEIKQLFGTDPAFVYVVLAMVITQVKKLMIQTYEYNKSMIS